MAQTTVVNIRYELCDVLIDRRTKWGNPFRIGTHGTREEVIAAYREYILKRPDLLAELYTLQGKRLGCWCKPDTCHGDVLVELIHEQSISSHLTLTPAMKPGSLFLPAMDAARAIKYLEATHFDLIWTTTLNTPRWVIGDRHTDMEIAEGKTIIEAVENAIKSDEAYQRMKK